MSNARLMPMAVLLGLLLAAPHGAGEEASALDGRWMARYTASPSAFYEMEFTGDRFRAVQGEQWYEGEISIDAQAEPARIDFTIRECDCGFLGKTSTGIFRRDGDAIEVRAPEPGKPRPTEFDEESGETMRLVRQAG